MSEKDISNIEIPSEFYKIMKDLLAVLCITLVQNLILEKLLCKEKLV